jgi:hypothetical protein
VLQVSYDTGEREGRNDAVWGEKGKVSEHVSLVERVGRTYKRGSG